MVKRDFSRKSLLHFTKHTFRGFQESWHHSLVCDALDAVVARKITRLIIQAPPRHSKTELVQRRFVPYLLGRDPTLEIIGASYSADLASRNNSDIQAIMEMPDFVELFPNTIIPKKGGKGGIRTQDFFKLPPIVEIEPGKTPLITPGGSYRSAGVDGGITGMGFDIGLIDDPLKNRKEAESLTVRESVWNWYVSTFYTRMDEADAAIVIIMTRWHEDDLVGRLLQLAKDDPAADQWVVINLPAIMEGNMERTVGDNREVGEALWPTKFNEARLAATKANQGSYDWESLFQQRPFPPGGRKIKTDRFKYIDRENVPASVRWAFFGDLAVSTKTTADFTSMGFIGLDVDGEVYLRDVTRFQKEWPDTRRAMINIFKREKPSLAGIEKAGQQQGFIDDINRNPEIQAIPVTVLHRPVDKDKLTRALPWIAKVEEGKFNIVNGAWVPDFETECAKFTGAGDLNDDQVDMVSGGYELVVSTYSNLSEMMVANTEALLGL